MIKSEQYQCDVAVTAQLPLNWGKLRSTSILLTGACGMIGTFLIDVLMYRNLVYHDNIKIRGVTRQRGEAEKKFASYLDRGLSFLEWDVTKPLQNPEPGYEYMIHGASNTHPLAYAADPVGTIGSNILGLWQLMKLAENHIPKRFLLMSSVEIYGENVTGIPAFGEKDLGYLDCNTLRAGYPESKRLSESICQAYRSQYGVDFVTARLSRVYGPTMRWEDSKALSQFIKNAVRGEDIVLKSEGNQYYSYTYVADAVAALLLILLEGQSGEAYNVADEKSDIRLKDLAGILAGYAGTRVVFKVPDQEERKGYSTATKAILDGEKIRRLGFKAQFPIEKGLEHTVRIMKEEMGL
ncbi:MAG: NAD-dependent epimerase/dehydratase family protein [Ruminococcus sp.]|jgi:UDP-glucuronate decarboxylase